MMKKLKQSNGITLIALVITIIVLLILAGVAISMLSGENGVLTKAQNAAQEQERVNIQELTILGFVYPDTAATVPYMYLDMEETAKGIYANLTNNGYKLKDDSGTDITSADKLLSENKELISLNVKGSHGEYFGEVTNTGLTKEGIKIKVSNNEPITPEPPLGEEIVTNPYEGIDWEFAYSSKDGVWSEKITNKADLDETIVEVVAKFYKTGNKLTVPSVMGINFVEGDEYALVIEGQGDMAPLSDGTNFYAWEQSIIQLLMSLKSGAISPGETIELPAEAMAKQIIICEGITNISNYAFMFYPSLPSVTMANTVQKIGLGTFNYSTISAIKMSNNLTEIGEMAFQYATYLESITLPNTLTVIEDNMFEECTNLKNITIPNSVTSIGEYAFYRCKSLESLIIPASVTTIGDSAFNECEGLKDLIISDGVTSIGGYAFWGCKNLESLTIPGSVETIGEVAFQHCEGLKKIVISHGVTSIGWGAFSYCKSLKEITIPGSIQDMGNTVFADNTCLEKVIFLEGVPSIYSQSFWDCTNLESIIIPKSVTSVSEHAFDNCSNLANIYYAGTEEDWNKITIGTYKNETFIAATKHYNYVYPTQEN